MTQKRITPKFAFACQRAQARRRKVDWKLTFEQWWQIWQDSGHWERRGRKWDCYVMCRVGDAGAYEAGNVFIGRMVENVSAASRRRHKGLPMGVFPNGKVWCAKRQINGRRVYLGVFPSPELAHAAYLRAAEIVARAA